MLVKNFKENCSQYDNFMVWDVENMDAFFTGNAVLAEIFKAEYKMPVEEFNDRRSEISETNMDIMENLLELIGDKHFFIFTYHDDNHWEIVQLQVQKIMDFGLDIEAIEKDHVYILIMDKRSEVKTLPI
ncbi:MAG: hypothetical protein QF371_01330 [Flavobacteriales bacterium]|nr:hypothetical protein [Flavobacteriales bacterium]